MKYGSFKSCTLWPHCFERTSVGNKVQMLAAFCFHCFEDDAKFAKVSALGLKVSVGGTLCCLCYDGKKLVQI